MTPKLKDLMEALQIILNRAKNHPAFDEQIFDDRDMDALIKFGGDVCDWTLTAIEADDALKGIKK